MFSQCKTIPQDKQLPVGSSRHQPLPSARSHPSEGIWSFLFNMHEGVLAHKHLMLYWIYTACLSLILCSLLSSNGGDDRKASCAIPSEGVQRVKEENKRKRKMLAHEVWQVVSTQ